MKQLKDLLHAVYLVSMANTEEKVDISEKLSHFDSAFSEFVYRDLSMSYYIKAKDNLIHIEKFGSAALCAVYKREKNLIDLKDYRTATSTYVLNYNYYVYLQQDKVGIEDFVGFNDLNDARAYFEEKKK